MPSNPKYVCVPCRTVFKGTVKCPSCGDSMQYVGPRWSPPKKNNDRAWKRIENGEWLWDRRRVKRRNRWWKHNATKDTVTVYQYERKPVEVDNWHDDGTHTVYRQTRIPGSGREVTNFNRKPHEVDFGG